MEGFRRATWDEALDLAAGNAIAKSSKNTVGMQSVHFAQQKPPTKTTMSSRNMFAAVLGTNNVDHCARLCHAASVAGLQIAIGSSAMSNSIAEMKDLEVFIVTGSNTSETHPVISTFLREAVVKNGAKLIVVDPRQIEMTQFADLWLRQNPGTDVALFQAMANVIVTEELYDADFITERVEDYDEYAHSIKSFTPEWAAEVTGVPAEHDPASRPHLCQCRSSCYLLGDGHQPKRPWHR